MMGGGFCISNADASGVVGWTVVTGEIHSVPSFLSSTRTFSANGSGEDTFAGHGARYPPLKERRQHCDRDRGLVSGASASCSRLDVRSTRVTASGADYYEVRVHTYTSKLARCMIASLLVAADSLAGKRHL